MQVIPVIDVRGGVVVHATGGDRAAYRPIETPLAAGAEPVAVARGLLAASGSCVLYMADLDGIAGRRWNMIAIGALRTAFPDVELWVDSGASRAGQLGELMELPRVVPVIGSETLESVYALAEIAVVTPSPLVGEGRGGGDGRTAVDVGFPPTPDPSPQGGGGFILSLDFKGDRFLGPPELLADPTPWPERVIVMTLAAVGADAGPDLARVVQIKRLAGEARQVFAAGGVRNNADLGALAATGAAGVLVASALHSGKIKAGGLGRRSPA